MNRVFTIAKDISKRPRLLDSLSLIRKWLFTDDRILIYVLRVRQVLNIGTSSFESISIRKGEVAELATYENDYSFLPWEFRCHKYDRVRDFFVAVNHDGIQHISWIYYQGDPNRIIKLGQKDAEIKYCLTLPAFRGKGLYPEVIKSIVLYLGQRGFHRVFISVDYENSASIRGIQKAGFQHLCQIRVRKIFGIQRSAKYTPPEL